MLTAAALVATLHARGISVERHGDRLRLCPADRLSEAERATLRVAKAEILALLAAPPRRDLQAERRRLYADLAADVATKEDCEALRWLTEHGHESLVGELLDLDGRCHALVHAGAPHAEFRGAVEAFVKRVREMRALHREKRTQ